MKVLREPGRFRIKQAAPDDLLPAARAKALAWRQSYPQLDQSVLERHDEQVEQTAASWEQSSRQGSYYWVVVDTAHESELVGICHARVSDATDAPTPLELAMMYLLDVAKGSGIADRLLEVAIGDAPAFLWVLEANKRAISFYRRHGFVADGARQRLHPGLYEIRMVRRAD